MIINDFMKPLFFKSLAPKSVNQVLIVNLVDH